MVCDLRLFTFTIFECIHMVFILGAMYLKNQGCHYSVDWTTGLDYWTHGNCLWRRKEQEYTEIHTTIQESRVIFHRSQHVRSAQLRSILVQVRDQKLEP